MRVSFATSAAMETDFGGEIVKSKKTRRLARSLSVAKSCRVVFVSLRQSFARNGMLVVTERDESIASHRTRKPEPRRTFAHPNSLHTTTLRVVVPGAKMLLKVAFCVGEIGLRFRR